MKIRMPKPSSFAKISVKPSTVPMKPSSIARALGLRRAGASPVQESGSGSEDGAGRSRLALVTGAGAGIGFHVTQELLRTGWTVIATDIAPKALQALPEAATGQLRIAQHNVVDAQGWQDVLDTHCGEGALDLLVNNAGILASGAFETIPLAKQLAMVDVNVKGLIAGAYTCHPYLVRAQAPRVINMASASAIYGQRELAVYSATKFAVRGFTEALDIEWEGQNIDVQSVWPLFVKTAMTDDMNIGTTRSLGINLTPEEVARIVVQIANGTRRSWSSPHRPVGMQATAMLWTSASSPGWVLRRVNARLAAHD